MALHQEQPTSLLDLFHQYEQLNLKATRLELTATAMPWTEGARREADTARLQLVQAMLDVENLKRAVSQPVPLEGWQDDLLALGDADRARPARDDDYGQGAGA